VWTVLILVCSISTPGDQCDQNTAVAVAGGSPERAANMCGLHGQSQLAQSAIVHSDEYQKIICSRNVAAAK
jgi:hypothetical protein